MKILNSVTWIVSHVINCIRITLCGRSLTCILLTDICVVILLIRPTTIPAYVYIYSNNIEVYNSTVKSDIF